jgi:hypothetical protein
LKGIRSEIWHGFYSSNRPPEKEQEFDRRKHELCAAAEAQLAEFRVFAARVTTAPRLLERLEAAIMATLYAISRRPSRSFPTGA